MAFAHTELIVEEESDTEGTGIIATTGRLLVDGRAVAMSAEHPVTVVASLEELTTATVTIIIDKVTMQKVNRP